MSTAVSIINRSSNSDLVAFGMHELTRALEERGASIRHANYWASVDDDHICLLIGECSTGIVKKVLYENGVEAKGKEEGVVVQWCNAGGKNMLVISGTDERGLMYALLELAEETRCRGIGRLSALTPVHEYPSNRIRGVDRFIMAERDDVWFYSTDFWNYFLSMLAYNRFNRFTLITGFDTAYMSPPYPFFVDVPGFADVKVTNLSQGDRKKSLEMLQTIGRLCGSFGIDFFFSSWQQMPWTSNQEFMVENIPTDDKEFTAYCTKGMSELLCSCPEIAGIQFRVNLEAGITSQGSQGNTHEEFWCRMIDSIASVGRPVKLDLRAKGLTDDMLEYALGSGLDVAVPTKYWCEHAALPYHIPQLRTEEMKNLKNLNSSRRYSYGNLLKKPHWYDMIYRLWNYGSTNLFLWGDPDYCRRFSESCGTFDGVGFQINSPLSLKGGHAFIQGSAWSIHINNELIDYTWEDERYWLYYLLFGRIGFDPHIGQDVWRRQLEHRFGAEACDHVESGYAWASKILPLITTVHFPVHPSLHYWPELCSGAALFGENNYDPYFNNISYAEALPSDEALFCSIAQYADGVLSGKQIAKYSPLQVRDWLRDFADKTTSTVREIESLTEGGEHPELDATVVDFTMLANLAEFHVWKIQAAFHLYVFEKTDSEEDLRQSYVAMIRARKWWSDLSDIGDQNYNHDLEFNAGTAIRRNGTWRDRLVHEIDVDVACLEKLLGEREVPLSVGTPDHIEGDRSMLTYVDSQRAIEVEVPERCKAGDEITVNVNVDALSLEGGISNVCLHYRHTNHTEGGYICEEMQRTDSGYCGTIPGSYVNPEWDLIVYLSALDEQKNGIIIPGPYHPIHSFPYVVTKVDGS